MKATGVVRRIDELGRIVVPKEVRRTMRIKEGESLEIFIEDTDKIVLKKYSLPSTSPGLGLLVVAEMESA